MFGVFQIIDQQTFLKKKEQELQSSRLTGKQKCSKSGFCCYQRPAAPTPDEIPQIAAYLKITVEKFIDKYLTIDKLQFDASNYFLRFISQDFPETAGRFLLGFQTFNRAPCIFLAEDHLCQIQEVKPRQCQEHGCWKKDSGFKAENEWKGNILKLKFGIDGNKIENGANY